jgi:hypothetical protein
MSLRQVLQVPFANPFRAQRGEAMTRVLFVVFVLFASHASAQTVVRTLDLSTLGWGQIVVEPIDADGDRTTEEWLVTKMNSPTYRVVAQRQGRYCIGDWFTPMPVNPLPFSFVSVKVVNTTGVTSLLVSDRWGWMGELIVHEVRLDIPPCH